MKKIIASAFGLVLALALAGCGKAEEKKVLRMATEATFPPYEYFENGKIVGIDVDIVGEVAGNLGYELKVVDMKFDSVILSVQTEKCDVAASGITVTEERKQQVNFTVPYVTAAQVIVVAKNSPIATPADLKNAKIRIGVQQGTTGDSFVTKNLHDPERFDNAGLAVAALRAGKLEAVVCDVEPAKVHQAKYSDELKILPVALTSEEYAFAFNKNDVELLKQFNAELNKMKKSGRLQQIIGKYIKQ